ncbi:pectate lyase [Frankia sp. Cpl3]|uniref:pectate lyase n=1 Tax=Parafrankia colletiae TaxID=573497 RepID=UPI000A065B21|nr:pectate lyase [Parafrankia colletiae]MCK9902773.1 pectate lyase [Frankia sp. Cpl3]
MTRQTDPTRRSWRSRRRDRRRDGRPAAPAAVRIGWGFPALTAVLLAATGALLAGPLTEGSPDRLADTATTAADASTLFADDFEDGDLSGWSRSGGSWSVVADGSKVLRQDKAGSVLARQFAGSTSWTDVTVQARVRPAGFPPGGGLAGVAARASSNTTFVRLALVAPGRVELQSVASGRITVVGAATLAVTPGRWYALALTVSGTTARGFVDGQPVASGPVPAGRGRIALMTALAAASFDDVTVTPATGTGTGTPAPTSPAATSPAATSPGSATPGPTPTVRPTTPTTPTPSPTRPATPPAPPASPPPATTGPLPSWPAATGDVRVDSTISVSGTFDGGLRRYSGVSDGGQEEGQDPIFVVADGGVVQNVIIGTPAADGIHCRGTCTLRNVWWEDVGEDAATFKGTAASQTMTIDGGGARAASDKVFQHNGPGTMIIQNFQVRDFGKLYRSCGNCSSQHRRAVIVRNVVVTAPGKTLVGINTNYGDTAQLSGITIVGDSSRRISVCDRYTGNSSGSEPTKTGSGADGTYCRYTAADITYR